MSDQVKKAKMACATVGDSATSIQVETAKIGWRDCPRQRDEKAGRKGQKGLRDCPRQRDEQRS